jgi:ATP-dependent Clp protease protease subunit
MAKLLNIKNFNKPFEIKNKTETTAEIVLYGAIGESWFEDSISAKDFHKELKALSSDVKEIHLRINSPGGDVFDGMTIYNRLKQHKAKVIVYIDGMAASIASIIAMAGDEIYLGEGSQIMIHKPWTGMYGNATDFMEVIDRLDDIEEQMVSIYSKKANIDRSEIKTLLANETWMLSDEAISYGFADEVVEQEYNVAAKWNGKLQNAAWIKNKPEDIDNSQYIQSKIEDVKKSIEETLAR